MREGLTVIDDSELDTPKVPSSYSGNRLWETERDCEDRINRPWKPTEGKRREEGVKDAEGRVRIAWRIAGAIYLHREQK